MKVRNLISWAGPDFSFLPGDIIDLDDETATARIAAGLAELPKDDGQDAKSIPPVSAEHQALLDEQASRAQSSAAASPRVDEAAEAEAAPDASDDADQSPKLRSAKSRR